MNSEEVEGSLNKIKKVFLSILKRSCSLYLFFTSFPSFQPFFFFFLINKWKAIDDQMKLPKKTFDD